MGLSKDTECYIALSSNVMTHKSTTGKCFVERACVTVEYTSCVWDQTNANINKLEMVQPRAVRYEKDQTSRATAVTDMLNELGWDTLPRTKTSQCYNVLPSFVWSGLCSIYSIFDPYPC